MLAERQLAHRPKRIEHAVRTTGSEIAESSRRLPRAPVAPMIVGVDGQPGGGGRRRESLVAQGVLGPPVQQVNDAARLARREPAEVGDGEAIVVFAFETVDLTTLSTCARLSA